MNRGDFMRYFRKIIAEKDEQLDDGYYSWMFYKHMKDLKDGCDYKCSGCSLPIEDVIKWEY